MDVVELFVQLGAQMHIEVIVAALPESPQPGAAFFRGSRPTATAHGILDGGPAAITRAGVI
jgi:hypothetical protein